MELQPSSSTSDSTSDGESSYSILSSIPSPKLIAAQSLAMTVVECSDRWQVYFRLQELEIPCECKSYQPLLVDIQSAQALIQVWSVVKRISTPRSALSEWLNQCLRLPSP